MNKVAEGPERENGMPKTHMIVEHNFKSNGLFLYI